MLVAGDKLEDRQRAKAVAYKGFGVAWHCQN